MRTFVCADAAGLQARDESRSAPPTESTLWIFLSVSDVSRLPSAPRRCICCLAYPGISWPTPRHRSLTHTHHTFVSRKKSSSPQCLCLPKLHCHGVIRSTVGIPSGVWIISARLPPSDFSPWCHFRKVMMPATCCSLFVSSSYPRLPQGSLATPAC